MEAHLKEAALREARDELLNPTGFQSPAYKNALRCVERMIPRPVHLETDSRKFQWEHSADSEYQCPLCGSPLIALEDEVAPDVIFHCQNCGQALEW